MRLIKVGLVAACLVALATPAQAAPSASMTIGPLTPSSPTPGQTVTATIRLSGCDATAIRLTSARGGTYEDFHQAFKPYPPVDAAPTSDPAVWTAPVKIPSDAYPYGDLDLVAAITCSSGSTSATGRVIVRPFAPPTVRVTPFAVRHDQTVTLVVSPCHGEFQSFRFTDNGQRVRPTSSAPVVRTGPTGYRITYVMDHYALPGYGTFRIQCAQNRDANVRVSVLAPATASPSPTASATSTPTPTASLTASPTPAVSSPAAVSPSPGPSTAALEPASSSSTSWWVVGLVAVLVGGGGSVLVRRLI
jgi:hypothetical protein